MLATDARELGLLDSSMVRPPVLFSAGESFPLDMGPAWEGRFETTMPVKQKTPQG
jgi:hypothetical protein